MPKSSIINDTIRSKKFTNQRLLQQEFKKELTRLLAYKYLRKVKIDDK